MQKKVKQDYLEALKRKRKTEFDDLIQKRLEGNSTPDDEERFRVLKKRKDHKKEQVEWKNRVKKLPKIYR